MLLFIFLVMLVTIFISFSEEKFLRYVTGRVAKAGFVA